MLSPESFIHSLVEAVPSVRPMYEEHIADNDGLLPHVFMGDVSRYVLRLWREISEVDDAEGKAEALSTILSCVEAGVRDGDETVKELLAASFLEDLGIWDSSIAGLENQFGPCLRRVVEAMRRDTVRES